MFCPQCRSELPDDAKFCIKCGYDFTKITTPQSRKASSDPLDDIETSIGQEIDASSFSKGSLFANRYEILDEGKKGGMGAVYKCKDTKLNNKIKALKVIHPRLLNSKQALQRFRQEVDICQELNHENIVRVYDIEEAEGKEYFTMEWIEGPTLREVITSRKAGNRPFSIDEAYRIISQLCDALQYAHQHTIHRDIKPENILVSDEKSLKVKITDFGIAKMLSPSQFTSTSMQMGTPYYMAPEQKTDAAHIDKRADIYALGVVLFELLTLENTIGLKLPSKINKRLSSEIDSIIEKALEPKPEDRYTDARELSDALHAVVTAETLRTEQKKKEEETRKIEAERRTQEEEQRKTEEAKRQEEKRQREAAEEKAKIEAERKKQEEEKLRHEKEAKGKNKGLIIVTVLIIVIVAAVFALRSRTSEQTTVEPLVTTEAPRPVEAPAPIVEPVTTESPTPSFSRERNGYEKKQLSKVTPVSWRKVCPIDGEVWPDDANYCGNHGVKLNREAVASVHSAEGKKAEEARKEQESKKSSIDMVSVKGGCFQMGDTFGDGQSDEKPVHEVCVDDFYIGKYEVTLEQWMEVMRSKPSAMKKCDKCPVEAVSWDDVQEFISRLNQKIGGIYRLPTEAEWEYACRDKGKNDKWAGTSNESSLSDYAWYASNSGSTTHPVGQKKSNGLGLYDMSGNVLEWVQDVYSKDAYSKHDRKNPIYNGSSSKRVQRGGRWTLIARYISCANRDGSSQDFGNTLFGFRLAKTN